MANVLYISFDGLTDGLGRSQVIPYLSGLSKKGHSITVLSCEKSENFQKQEATVSQLLQESNIDWYHLPYNNRPPFLGPFLLAKKVKNLATRLHKEKTFQIAHCRSYMASLVGVFLKKRFGLKYIFDMRGFWADERVDGKVWNLSNPLFNLVYRYFKKKEKTFLQEADYIVSLTQNAKDEIHNWSHIGGKDLPIKVIPCCVDLDRFSKEKVNQEKATYFKNELKILEQDFVLTYLGSIGTWYMLDEMLDFFKVLLEKKPNAKFLFISKKEKERIFSLAKEKGIPQEKIIVNGVVFDDVPTLLSLSSATIFFIQPVFSKKASSPIKQGELMAMQIPIVCNTGVGDTDYIIEQSEAGALVQNFETVDYQKSIELLLNESVFSAEESRNGATTFYALEKGVESYHKVYQTVLEK